MLISLKKSKMNYSKRLGLFVKQKLAEQDKSKSVLIKECGFTETEIDELLKGKLFLTPNRIENLASLLDMSVENILNL